MNSLNVNGNVRVFKNQKGFCSIGISKKNQETGEYKTKYMNVSFKKGTNIENGTDIIIKNGFYTYDTYTDKNGVEQTAWRLMILDFDVQGDAFEIPQEKNDVINDDLPF